MPQKLLLGREALAMPYPRQCDRIAGRAHGLFLAVCATSMGAFLIWSNVTYLDKVTRGGGRVVPQVQNQTVQHFEGGIVTEILVREGERVAKGTPVLRIENSFSRAELLQAKLEIKARRIRIARLAAEAKIEQVFQTPEDLRTDIPGLIEREQALFDSRRRILSEQLLIIEDQRRQKELEFSELKSRWSNTTRERELVLQRVTSLRRLVTLGAVSSNELLDNERNLQQIESKLSDLSHEIPRTESALSEISRRRTEALLRFSTDAEKDRAEAELQLAKLNEAVFAMQDRSVRSEVLAPIGGIVNKLFVSTVGGVVKSGEPLAVIVPIDSSIAVEAKLSPTDRAEVWPGLPAIVKISAYDYSVYGGLKGKVTDVSPDALQDERGQPYFRVRLEANTSDFGPDKPVVPGMLAEVDILTGRNSIMDTLLKPVRRLRDNALRQ